LLNEGNLHGINLRVSFEFGCGSLFAETVQHHSNTAIQTPRLSSQKRACLHHVSGYMPVITLLYII